MLPLSAEVRFLAVGGSAMTVKADVTNAGQRAGDEVVRVYVSDVQAAVPVPPRRLEKFERIHLKPGQKRTAAFKLKSEQLAAHDKEGRPFVEPGEFVIAVGHGQPIDAAGAGLTARLTVR